MSVMKQSMLKLLIETAQEVRGWAEAVAWEEEFPNDLCGLCAIASAEVWERLNELDIKSTICVSEKYGEAHCFVVIDETDTLIDVTATQFNMAEVVVKDYKECKASFWDITHRFFAPKELVVWQNRSDWPFEQIARV